MNPKADARFGFELAPQIEDLVHRIHRALLCRPGYGNDRHRKLAAPKRDVDLVFQIARAHAEQAIDIHRDDTFPTDPQQIGGLGDAVVTRRGDENRWRPLLEARTNAAVRDTE